MRMKQASHELEDLEAEIGTGNTRIGPSSDNERGFSPLATCPKESVERFRRRGELAATSYGAAVELKCFECCTWDRPEAKRRQIVSCPLWEISGRIFRRGRGPRESPREKVSTGPRTQGPRGPVGF